MASIGATVGGRRGKKLAESLYAKVQGKASKPTPAQPAGESIAAPGETQPFVLDDPFAASVAVPSGLSSMPVAYMGPGAFDKRSAKMDQAAGREAQRHVYKTPDEYYSQLGTVMGSPLMQKLSSGVKNLEGLREQFLQHAPVQADLSPLMGLADFVANGKGNALRSYKRPDDYNDLVAKLAGLMQQEQSAAYNQANLAMNQVPLKSGDDTASVKAGVDQERGQGYQVPRPPNPNAGMQNPLNQALAIQRAFQGLGPYKAAESTRQSAIGMLEVMKNPSWAADDALRGQMLQALKIAPISEKEMAEFGRGSPDYMNKVQNAISRATTGRSLSPQDYKIIEDLAHRRLEYATKELQAVQDKFVNSLGPYAPAFSNEGIRGLTEPTMTPDASGVGKRDAGQSDSDKKFDAVMDRIFK